MKKRLFALCMIILMLFVHGIALANAAEPPGLTVIVNNPPDGLALSLQLDNDDTASLAAEHRFWEGQYKFYYHDIPGSRDYIKSAVLTVSGNGEDIQITIPKEYFGYNNQVTLNLKTNELTQGQNPMRAPLLTAMRVILTLIIEGVVLYAFGYRTKQSILLFLITNIITQTALNVLFIGAGSYWFMLYVVVETLIFIIETVIYKNRLTEHGKKRAILYSLTANTASLILGGWMISCLPV